MFFLKNLSSFISFTVGPIGPQANILQEAQVDVMAQAGCINAWRVLDVNINNGHVCVTDVANKAKGACIVSMLFCDINKLKFYVMKLICFYKVLINLHLIFISVLYYFYCIFHISL